MIRYDTDIGILASLICDVHLASAYLRTRDPDAPAAPVKAAVTVHRGQALCEECYESVMEAEYGHG